MKHLGEANGSKFDKGLVRRKIHKSGMWEKGMESPNEIHFPWFSLCAGTTKSGSRRGGSSGDSDAAVDKLVQKWFGSSLKLVTKRQAALYCTMWVRR